MLGLTACPATAAALLGLTRLRDGLAAGWLPNSTMAGTCGQARPDGQKAHPDVEREAPSADSRALPHGVRGSRSGTECPVHGLHTGTFPYLDSRFHQGIPTRVYVVFSFRLLTSQRTSSGAGALCQSYPFLRATAPGCRWVSARVAGCRRSPTPTRPDIFHTFLGERPQ